MITVGALRINLNITKAFSSTFLMHLYLINHKVIDQSSPFYRACYPESFTFTILMITRLVHIEIDMSYLNGKNKYESNPYFVIQRINRSQI